jgi:nucleotide-binding universal stress UspA family protein
MTTPRGTHGILVGYDGSWEGDRALYWAAHEARVRRAGLTVCTAWVPIDFITSEDEPAVKLGQFPAERAVADGVTKAGRILDRQHIRSLPVRGPAAQVLCDHARHAEMVVVGSIGGSGIADLLLGSVSSQVAAHAPGRVVVVRGGARTTRYVPGDLVAGYDGSPASQTALGRAFEEARLHEAPLVVVRAWQDHDGTTGSTVSVAREQAENDLRAAVATWQERFPGVGARPRFVDGAVRKVLPAEGRHARLLVVGSRGIGGFRGLLGSVSQAVLHDAPCPVMIVHAAGPAARDEATSMASSR